MLQLRVITPADRTDAVCEVLADNPGVTGVIVLPGAARSPAGDVVQCDVAREAATEVIDALRALGLERDGSITLQHVELSISAAADQAERDAPGYGDDAVVWQDLDRQTADGARLTWSYLAFLSLATQLAAIGVLINSPILIVGAMVLGPEFGPVAAICFGLVRRRPARIRRALVNLVIGFAVAIAITLACAAVSRGLGWIQPEMLDHNAETDFIVKPDKFSFIVALLAGAAGVLSITAGKSSALVGVFISVTTVPAAGNIADAIAFGRGDQVWESAIQLGVNLAGMTVAGTATLLIQRAAWSYARRKGWPKGPDARTTLV